MGPLQAVAHCQSYLTLWGLLFKGKQFTEPNQKELGREIIFHKWPCLPKRFPNPKKTEKIANPVSLQPYIPLTISSPLAALCVNQSWPPSSILLEASDLRGLSDIALSRLNFGETFLGLGWSLLGWFPHLLWSTRCSSGPAITALRYSKLVRHSSIHSSLAAWNNNLLKRITN